MKLLHLIFLLLIGITGQSQKIIPIDTSHWNIDVKAYILEKYEGKDAIYIQQGIMVLKDSTFINGTIEFDMYLTERQSFPGIRFRITDDRNMESFFVRPHLSGKSDANQAAPLVNGITAFQFYFGPSYSFPYSYKFDDWTHVKLVVNNDKAQVYLDYSEIPNLSWNLKHKPKAGKIGIGGSFAPTHYANFKMNKQEKTIKKFKVSERKPLEDIIPKWQISDKFQERLIQDINQLDNTIRNRKWNSIISVEENVAANISNEVVLYNNVPGNTVFAKINIDSDKDQMKLFEFGYSDRVVVILNGIPIYKGNNKWRSRDYRYLGTIGLFDAAYLPLKEGKNTLLLAVSEDFGGWLVTGRFKNMDGLTIKYD